MYKVIDTFKSLFYIVRLFFKREKTQVLFYYPQHFNRGNDGSNEFLKPLINCCKKNNISFLVFEEPADTDAPRSKNTIPFDFIYYFAILLRKLLPLHKYIHFEAREWEISHLLKRLFLKNINPEIVITMSNSMVSFFRGWGENIAIYDYQHGIVFSWHQGYMVDNKPAQHIVNNKSKVMLYGAGFKNLLTKGHDNYFNDNSVVIGTTSVFRCIHEEFNGAILISLQITTADEMSVVNTILLQQLKELFGKHQAYYIENNIIFYVKHHPRFDGSFDISSILNFPFVKIITKALPHCFVDCSVHMTFNSTTTFDAAVVGIPTIFIGENLENVLFEKEFQYPDFLNYAAIQKKIEDYLETPSKYKNDSLVVQKWVRNYYTPFNEVEFLRLINERHN